MAAQTPRAVRVRRGVFLSGLLACALAALVAAAGASAASERAVRLWSHAIRSTSVPGAGCFHASYPTVTWRRVRCARALHPRVHENPPHAAPGGASFGPFPQVGGEGEVGGGHGGVYSAKVPAGTITSAVGSIPSVSGGATEEDEGTAEKFSLQMNSNTFSGATECGAIPGCEGWEQFVYSSSWNQVFIEFWLINHQKPKEGNECPKGWSWLGPQKEPELEYLEGDCNLKSELTTLPGGALKVSGLTGTTLEGRANSGGLDSVVMITGGGSAVATGAANLLNLDKGWTIAEFAVIGDFNGTKADFSSNTTMTVNTGIRPSTLSDAAPLCVNTSFTAESNNLTAEGTPSLSPQPFPTVSSQQTNGAATPASCATYGISPPTVTLTTPPNGASYSYGQFVEAQYSCEPAPGATLKSCTGTVPKGAAISTTTGPSDSFSVTAEDTDGQTETVTHTYTVTAPPKATIEAPPGGGTYKEGEVVATKFSCEEGEFGPGLQSCIDSNGATGGVGALDTSGLGAATYEVTAKSKDGRTGTASIAYTLISACNSAHGWGRVGSLSSEGVIYFDVLSKTPGAKEQFEAGVQKPTLGRVFIKATSLSSSACLVIPGGLEFRGEGPATVKQVGGYTVAFAFAVVGSHITFSIELHKGATLEYKSTKATAVPGSLEKLS